MPKVAVTLTDTKIRQAPTPVRPVRIFDAAVVGLHVLIQPSGAKLWRLRYKFAGNEKRVALGSYPQLMLADARKKALGILEQVRNGVDPAAPLVPTEVNTFGMIAEKFVDWKESVLNRAGATIRKYRECLNNDLLPALRHKDIATLHPIDVVPVLESIDRRSNSLARKNQELVSMIIKYAIQRGYRPPYSQMDLSGVIARKKRTPKRIPENLQTTYRKIDTYSEVVMQYAMRLQFLCFLRSSETMGGEWKEFDLKKGEWIVPPHRIETEDGKMLGGMKMKRPHVVPLAKQAITLLKELKKITGNTPYLFPSQHKESGMHRDSLSKAFRELNMLMVPHACRTAASTWLKNHGFAPHIVEVQLSHIETNEVAAAYHDQPHLMYLAERHKMMQAWADYITK